MKKNNLAVFFKSKSFYALLCVGALAIVTIAMVGLNRASEKNKNQNLADLNGPIVSDVADGENNSNLDADQPNINNTNPSDVANNVGNGQMEVAEGDSETPFTDGSLLEFDVYDEPQNTASGETAATSENAEGSAAQSASTTDTQSANATNTQSASTTGTQTVNETKKEEVQAVMQPATLNFNPDKGLLWPVTGNVIKNYSMDRVIYFETLEQFRTNPAIIIDAKVGTEVLSAAKGKITSITDEDETGLTVTASIGNGYSLVYGQLENVTVKVGDTIKEGAVLGKVAAPTKYYSVEGSNLYFQVLKDEETMNPMTLLR